MTITARLVLWLVLAAALVASGWGLRARWERANELQARLVAAEAAADSQRVSARWRAQAQGAKDEADKRAAALALAAAGVRGERNRLRDEIARRGAMPIDTPAAERDAAGRARAALDECAGEVERLAGELDGRESELRALMQAWPRP